MNQKFYNTLGCTYLWCIYHMTEEVQAVKGTRSGWYYYGSWCANVVHCFTPMSNFKAARLNEQHHLIWELMLYEFELTHNFTKATKNMFYKRWKHYCLQYSNQKVKKIFLGFQESSTQLIGSKYCKVQKTLKLQYYLLTSPRPLTPCTKGRWSKYYLPKAYPKKALQL